MELPSLVMLKIAIVESMRQKDRMDKLELIAMKSKINQEETTRAMPYVKWELPNRTQLRLNDLIDAVEPTVTQSKHESEDANRHVPKTEKENPGRPKDPIDAELP